jgi:hypothetical protein
MTQTVTTQTLELLAWIRERPRSYAETMETWGSHCPRHPVWEDAIADGLVEVVGSTVRLTASATAIVDGR